MTSVDLAGPWSSDDQISLLSLMRDRRLLLFRHTDLAVEDQIRLVGLFAKVWDEKGDGSKHIFVSNAKEGAVLGRPDGLMFHSDCVYTSAPLAVLSLFATQLPASPSPTVFADNISVMNDLPAAVRRRLSQARGRFVGGLGGYEKLRDRTAPQAASRVDHPILYPDRLAGQPALIIDQLYFDHFVGWDADDSDAVRAEIQQHTYAEQNVYLHNWQVGDLLLWDNVGLQHGRRPVPGDGPRTLRRVVGIDPSVSEYEHLAVKALDIEAARGR